jgi:HAD superfamily hydrolase (TIGR01450 family)
MDIGLGRLSGTYEAIVFDLDGTLFRGGAAIPGAPEAIRALQEEERCLFLSNNGESASGSLAGRLAAMGFDVRSEDVISSADLVLERLQALKPGASLFPLVSEELAARLTDAGFDLEGGESVDFVVVGVDRSLTRPRLVGALRALLSGAALVATNEDPTYPSVDGLRPAAGAYVGFFRGMGFEPSWFCGKPDESAVRAALARWGVRRPTETLFVGDNLRTDVPAARRIGAESALVLTGVSRREDVDASPAQPTAVVADVGRLAKHLLGRQSGEPVGRGLAAGKREGCA